MAPAKERTVGLGHCALVRRPAVAADEALRVDEMLVALGAGDEQDGRLVILPGRVALAAEGAGAGPRVAHADHVRDREGEAASQVDAREDLADRVRVLIEERAAGLAQFRGVVAHVPRAILCYIITLNAITNF